VLHSLLSGRRTALVMPWAKGEAKPLSLRAEPAEASATLAWLQPGVIVNVKTCTGQWCEVVVVRDGASDIEGYMHQDKLWGVYPNEKVE
jgi:SH3-like domain-containing protein